jgi:serine/threonine-protein kinase
MEFTPTQFSQRVVDLGLVEPSTMDQVWSEVGVGQTTCEDLVRVLLRRELLTNLQVDRVLRNERTGFFYGKYKVLYLIGAGTFARVYRGVHRESGRVAAVKVLRSRWRNEPLQVEQFLREARVGMQLRHPNIVAIHEVDSDPRNPFMVMEFVEGQTLREMLPIRKTIDPITALKLMGDVANALAYAQSQGVTHRDMKLSNILVTSTGRAKLVDFGLAALADTSNEDAVADCPSARAIDYAALERGSGVRKDDPRSDLYFWGTCLYHILTGRSPMTETRDRLARLNVSRFREVEHITKVNPDIPASVAMIVHRAMEFDVTKRYQNPAEVVQDVRLTIDRLQAGDTQSSLKRPDHEDSLPDASVEGANKIVMLVESKIEFQDLIREKLKKRGYRVLVIGDPNRALARFNPDDEPPAHCVLFSTPELGASALDAYNRFATDQHTSHIPAILLVDRKQQYIIRNAKPGAHRMMLAMPLKVRELRVALLRLLKKPSQGAAASAGESQ